jgi:hypothetical protein
VDSGRLFLIFLIIKNQLFLNGFFEVTVNQLPTALSIQTLLPDVISNTPSLSPLCGHLTVSLQGGQNLQGFTMSMFMESLPCYLTRLPSDSCGKKMAVFLL